MKFRDISGNEILTSQAALDVGMFGDGSDGTVTFDGTSTVLGLVPSSNTYTLNRSIFCSGITINSGVTIKTAGYKVFCTGALLNNGTIINAGTSAANASGS